MRAHYLARDENIGQFYLLNHFRAALPVHLRRVINLQPMPTLTWTMQSDWLQLSFLPRRRHDQHQGYMLFNPKRRRKELKQLHKINPSILKGFNNKISKIDLHRIARTFILKITTGETRINPPGDPTTIPVTTLTKIR